MTEVVVARCVLRITRTSGWSWGDSPDELLAAASRALPQLIAGRLSVFAAGLSEATESVHVTSPVRVRVQTTLAELAALGRRADSDPVSNSPSPVGSLEQRVLAELARSLTHVIEHTVEWDNPTLPPTDETTPDPLLLQESPTGETRGSTVRRLLKRWHAHGQLQTILSSIDGSALVRFHDALLPNVLCSLPPSPSLLDRAQRAIRALALPVHSGPSVLRARLTIAVELLADTPELDATTLRAAVDAVLDPSVLDGGRTASERAQQSPEELAAAVPGPSGALHRSVAPSVPMAGPSRPLPVGAEYELPSALPFLLLPSLHHAGWLDALAALLDTHEATELGFALAAALAGKVTPAPERGWLRRREERRAITVFAGSATQVDDEHVRNALPRLLPLLPALDASLRAVLARSRKADAPLVLWRGTSGFTWFDSDGFVALRSGTEALQPPLAAPVIVPASAADSDTLERLDLSNARFITDAPPTRGEPWRSFSSHGGRLWTNDTATPIAQLRLLTREIDDLIAHAAELAEALDARPAVPRGSVAALEASVTLAVTAALSDMAGRLFPHERGTPMLPLLRFADLDARVQVDDACVRVRVPLGRRHADLMRHGFLTTLTSVPWLGGRDLDIGGA